MSKKIFSKNNLNLAGGIILGFLVVTSFQNCLPTSQKTKIELVHSNLGASVGKADKSTNLSSTTPTTTTTSSETPVTHRLQVRTYAKNSSFEFNNQSPNYEIPFTVAASDADKNRLNQDFTPEVPVFIADISNNYQFRDSDLNCITTLLTFVDSKNQLRVLNSLDQISLRFELPVSNTEKIVRPIPFYKGASCIKSATNPSLDKAAIFSANPHEQIISFLIPTDVAIRLLDGVGTLPIPDPQNPGLHFDSLSLPKAEIFIKLDHQTSETDLFSEYSFYLNLL
jgi:hypothetical protein